jgi:hypothetical protein
VRSSRWSKTQGWVKEVRGLDRAAPADSQLPVRADFRRGPLPVDVGQLALDAVVGFLFPAESARTKGGSRQGRRATGSPRPSPTRRQAARLWHYMRPAPWRSMIRRAGGSPIHRQPSQRLARASAVPPSNDQPANRDQAT